MTWRDVQLGDVVEFFDYERIPLSTLEREKRQGEYRYYGAQGVIDYIDEYIFDGEYVLVAEDGANLVTRNQPIAFLVDGKFWVNNHAHILKGKSGLTTNYYIKSLLNNISISGYVTGAAQPKLNQKNLKSVRVTLPSYSVQNKIASILSAYDNLIENNNRRIALLEESARLLYREWFVRLRFPGHENTRITDGVPEGWKMGKVGDLGNIITGKTPSTKVPEYYGGDIPFVKTPDMHGRVFVLETESYLTDEGAKTQPKKFIPEDSIMVSCIGTVGIVSITQAVCHTNQQINSVIPNNRTNLYYCYFALRGLKEPMLAIGGGVTMSNVNKSKFTNLDILLPELNVTRGFYEFCQPVFTQIKTLQAQNQKLKAARDLLLPKLMNGEISV